MPALRVSAGARFTVRRLTGNFMPLVLMALRTRSRASLTAASGRPTISNPGKPLDTWHSTLTA